MDIAAGSYVSQRCRARISGYRARLSRNASTFAFGIWPLDSRHLRSDPSSHLLHPTARIPHPFFPLHRINTRLPSPMSLVLVAHHHHHHHHHLLLHSVTHHKERKRKPNLAGGSASEKETAMNDAIESRVEALAFQYVGLGLFAVVNNLWTLVAVVTAAVSVWSIRAAAGSSTVRRHHQPRPAPPCGDGDTIGRRDGRGPIPERRTADATEESAPAALDHSSPTSTSADYPSSDLVDGVTKGRRKFTAYYKDDVGCEREGAAEEEEEEEAREGGSCGGAEWWESWERVLKARNGEMSWYRCQDTGVINGAVVRLWDESRRGSGKMDDSRCAVW